MIARRKERGEERVEGTINKNRLSKGECKNRKEDGDRDRVAREDGSRSARMGDQHGLVDRREGGEEKREEHTQAEREEEEVRIWRMCGG